MTMTSCCVSSRSNSKRLDYHAIQQSELALAIIPEGLLYLTGRPYEGFAINKQLK